MVEVAIAPEAGYAKCGARFRIAAVGVWGSRPEVKRANAVPENGLASISVDRWDARATRVTERAVVGAVVSGDPAFSAVEAQAVVTA